MAQDDTRQRLLAEGMRLFGEHGYRATTVARIEGAAGLSPRAGGFYRHFESKEALFLACLEGWIADIAAIERELAGLVPVDDLRSELTVTARAALRTLERQRDLFRVLARDGDAFPEIAGRVHDELVGRGYEQMRRQLRRLLRQRGRGLPAGDLDALAAVALGSLVHYRDDEAIYGHPPAGAREDRFVAMWVDLVATWLEAPAGDGDAG